MNPVLSNDYFLTTVKCGATYFASCILNGHINNLNKRIARDRGILEAGV